MNSLHIVLKDLSKLVCSWICIMSGSSVGVVHVNCTNFSLGEKACVQGYVMGSSAVYYSITAAGFLSVLVC